MERVGVNRNEDDLLFRDALPQRARKIEFARYQRRFTPTIDVIELEFCGVVRTNCSLRVTETLAALFFSRISFRRLHDVVDVARLGDAVARRAGIGAAVAGVEDDVHAGEIPRVRALGELRALAFCHLGSQARRIVGRPVLRQQQRHRDFYGVADRNLRDIVDGVELHDALDDVADVLRVDAAGEADGHRGVERLPFLQPVDGVRFGRVALIRQRRLPYGRRQCRLRYIFIR